MGPTEGVPARGPKPKDESEDARDTVRFPRVDPATDSPPDADDVDPEERDALARAAGLPPGRVPRAPR